MSKEAYYFSHDYDPTGDPKIQALLAEYGGLGYGVFWRITEMLHSDEKHKLPLKQYIFIAIAKQMLTSAEQIEAIIKYCIMVCELFVSDGVYFYSNRVNSNFEKRTELSEKRSLAGKAGAIAKQNLANTSKGKERKGKEIKGNINKEEKSFAPPSLDEVKIYFKENGYNNAERFFNGYSVADWKDSKGNKIKNWKQKAQMVWFKDDNKTITLNKDELGTGENYVNGVRMCLTKVIPPGTRPRPSTLHKWSDTQNDWIYGN